MLLRDAYLYARMYYNKMRKVAEVWWQHYLLCKCCVLVVPLYTFLLLIGLYCILAQIEVTGPLKTLYELAILILSAAAIFIIVLLLATLNGDASDPEAELDEAILRRRNRSNHQPQSISSSIMTTLFGDYDDPEDGADPELEDIIVEENLPQPNLLISNVANITTAAELNIAQSRLITTMERATDHLEDFFDQCNQFESSPSNSHTISNANITPIIGLDFDNPHLFHMPGLGLDSNSNLNSPFYSNHSERPPPKYQENLGVFVGDLPPSYEEAIRHMEP